MGWLTRRRAGRPAVAVPAPVETKEHRSRLVDLPAQEDLVAASAQLLDLCGEWRLPTSGVRQLLTPARHVLSSDQPLEMWVEAEDWLLTVELYTAGTLERLFGVDHWLGPGEAPPARTRSDDLHVPRQPGAPETTLRPRPEG